MCEIASLELQRFLGISKSDRIKLRAIFWGSGASVVEKGTDGGEGRDSGVERR